MIETGILNPHILSLLGRVRHTNYLAIADRGFPSWKGVETVDISLVDNVPTCAQVLQAIRPNFKIKQIFMAEEFKHNNAMTGALRQLQKMLGDFTVIYEPHSELKKRVPLATGLIRTGETIQYANMVIESG